MALGARPGCFLNEIVCSLEDSSFMQKHCVCFLPEVDHLSAPWCKVLVTSEMYFTSCTVAKLFYEVYHLNFGNNILSFQFVYGIGCCQHITRWFRILDYCFNLLVGLAGSASSVQSEFILAT